MAMGNSLSPVVSNIFMEYSEALDTAAHKPAKWLRYVHDTFVVWPHEQARLQAFLHGPNSLKPTVKFRIEVEVNNTLPFLDVMVMKIGSNLVTKVYCLDISPIWTLIVEADVRKPQLSPV
jgi:hypothetical protein